MAFEMVENKFLQINKWGTATDPGVISLETEQLDFKNV